MSNVKPKLPVTIPVIKGLVRDITPHVVQALRSPSMRSLARTNKEWNRYLNKAWHLNARNFSYARIHIEKHEYPSLRLIQVAEKLAQVASTRRVLSFMKFVEPGKDSTSATSLFRMKTIVSARTGKCLPGSLQALIGDSTGWDFDNKVVSLNVETLVGNFLEPARKEKILLDDLLRILSMLPDRQKAQAFKHLIWGLCKLKGFNYQNGQFWGSRNARESNFQSMLPQLLPSTWNASLCADDQFNIGDPEANFYLSFLSHHSSFGNAVMVCLRTQRPFVPAFTFALLELLKTRAHSLPPKKQTWSSLRAHLKKQEAKEKKDARGMGVMKTSVREYSLIKYLLYAAFVWGMPDKETLKQCKNILCGSGFMTALEWKNLRQSAFDHYRLINTNPFDVNHTG